MNTVYHLLARTYEEYKAKIDRMASEGDPALCCASVIWRPSGLTEYHEPRKESRFAGQTLYKMFPRLGVQGASMLFYNLTKSGKFTDDEAFEKCLAKESERRNEYNDFDDFYS